MHSIESNTFDNEQIFKYLNDFDNLFPNQKLLFVKNHEDGIRPYQDKYETFNRVRVIKEAAMELKALKEASF